MATSDGSHRGGWELWLAGALLASWALVGLVYYWLSPPVTSDAKLMEELAAAELVDDPAPTTEAWPQWRGEHRNGIANITNLRTDWPAEGVTPLWRVALSGGQSSMAIADGKVITMTQEGDQELILAIDAFAGKERWRFSYPARFKNPQVSGPSSTPTIADGRVFTVGATGLFHCLDAATGAKLWEHDLLKEFDAPNLRWGTSFSPLVDGDLVFANPGGPKGSSVAAFQARTGELTWKSLDDPAGYSSPMAATIGGVRQVIFFTGNSLVGVQAADGKELWRYPWQTQFDVNVATPLLLRARQGDRELDYVFISSGYNKGCALLKIEAADGSFQAKRVYSGNQLKTHFSSTVRVGGHIYGFDDPGLLTCLDLKTGQSLWQEKGFQKGSLLAAAGHLIVLGEEGRLGWVEASAEGYREKAAWQVLEGRCWAAPALANGRLYVRNEKELLCVEIDSKGQ